MGPAATVSQALALRARIVLGAAAGASHRELAEQLGCHPATVGQWHTRFLERGVQGLLDEPRVGRPREHGDDKVEQIVLDTLQSAPPDAATHGSTPTMAAHAQVSQTFVSRVSRAFDLKPHLHETFELSTDPQAIEKVRDVVGL